jgi:hypothetical protein
MKLVGIYFSIYLFIFWVYRKGRCGGQFFFTVQKTAQKSALHSVPLSLSIYIYTYEHQLYIYIVNVFMISWKKTKVKIQWLIYCWLTSGLTWLALIITAGRNDEPFNFTVKKQVQWGYHGIQYDVYMWCTSTISTVAISTM